MIKRLIGFSGLKKKIIDYIESTISYDEPYSSMVKSLGLPAHVLPVLGGSGYPTKQLTLEKRDGYFFVGKGINLDSEMVKKYPFLCCMKSKDSPKQLTYDPSPVKIYRELNFENAMHELGLRSNDGFAPHYIIQHILCIDINLYPDNNDFSPIKRLLVGSDLDGYIPLSGEFNGFVNDVCNTVNLILFVIFIGDVYFFMHKKIEYTEQNFNLFVEALSSANVNSYHYTSPVNIDALTGTHGDLFSAKDVGVCLSNSYTFYKSKNTSSRASRKHSCWDIFRYMEFRGVTDPEGEGI